MNIFRTFQDANPIILSTRRLRHFLLYLLKKLTKPTPVILRSKMPKWLGKITKEELHPTRDRKQNFVSFNAFMIRKLHNKTKKLIQLWKYIEEHYCSRATIHNKNFSSKKRLRNDCKQLRWKVFFLCARY